jgi:hypothetical protein
MAPRPLWTEDEWLLLVDLFSQAGPHPPDDAVERLRADLQRLALRGDDPHRREAAREPSYRSHRSIRAQLSVLEAVAEERLGYAPQLRLQQVWDLFRTDPEAVRGKALAIRRGLASGDEDITPSDANAIKRFVTEARDLTFEVVRIMEQLPASNLHEDVLRAYLAAWGELQDRPVVSMISQELDSPENAAPAGRWPGRCPAGVQARRMATRSRRVVGDTKSGVAEASIPMGRHSPGQLEPGPPRTRGRDVQGIQGGHRGRSRRSSSAGRLHSCSIAGIRPPAGGNIPGSGRLSYPASGRARTRRIDQRPNNRPTRAPRGVRDSSCTTTIDEVACAHNQCPGSWRFHVRVIP